MTTHPEDCKCVGCEFCNMMYDEAMEEMPEDFNSEEESK